MTETEKKLKERLKKLINLYKQMKKLSASIHQQVDLIMVLVDEIEG